MNFWVEVDVRPPTTTHHERPMRPYSPGFWINYQHCPRRRRRRHLYYHHHSSRSSSNHNYHRFKICFHPISTYHPFPVVVRPPPPKREYPLLTTRTTMTTRTTLYPVRNVVPIGMSWRVSYPSRTCFTDPPPIKTAMTMTTNTTMKNYHFQRNNRTL